MDKSDRLSQLERVFTLYRTLSDRRTPIPRADLEEKLNCSRATLTRLIKLCREQLNLPIEYDGEQQGYYLERLNGKACELPGLWFNSAEIYALLTSHRLLTEIKPGLFEPYIEPLRERLETLLKHRHAGSGEIFERVRILPVAPREARLEDFRLIASALVERRQLRVKYSSRSKEELSERWLSPQRLIYYRDNWYLDAWCHGKEELRTFSLDRLSVAEAGRLAIDIPNRQLDDHFTPGYGLFAGPARHRAVIHFSDFAARWVADEQWHPEQTQRKLPEGGWEITVPYSDPRELIRDILKYGPDARVISPPALKRQVAKNLEQALQNYRQPAHGAALSHSPSRSSKGNTGHNSGGTAQKTQK